MLCDTFPVWYHVAFLVSLVPLSCPGGTMTIAVNGDYCAAAV